nr:hypothetical protein [Tanacetum cinerariifolium]
MKRKQIKGLAEWLRCSCEEQEVMGCLFVVGVSGGGSGSGVRVVEWQENGESGVVESWREIWVLVCCGGEWWRWWEWCESGGVAGKRGEWGCGELAGNLVNRDEQ